MKRIYVLLGIIGLLMSAVSGIAQGKKNPDKEPPKKSSEGDNKPKTGSGGDENKPKPGRGGSNSDDNKPKTGSGSDDNKPKPGRGGSNSDDNKPKPGQGGSNSGENKPKPSQSSGNQDWRNPVQGGSGTISQGQSSGNPLNRQGRSDGPVFVPRTGGGPVQTNNNKQIVRGSSSGSLNIPTPTAGASRTTLNRGSIPYQIQRMEDYRVGDLRHGYNSWDPSWRDCNFGYRYYSYVPVQWVCFSPYYWYVNVPGYLNCNRVTYVSPFTWPLIGPELNWNYCGLGSRRGYNNRYDDYSYNSRPVLDRVLSDLVDIFLYSETQLLDRLLPRRGSVDIYINNGYSYSMSGDDYYDMTSDMICSSNTTNFNIVSVRKIEGGMFRVSARHDFVDPYNYRQSSWMSFVLKYDGNWYRIVEAGTSRSRINY